MTARIVSIQSKLESEVINRARSWRHRWKELAEYPNSEMREDAMEVACISLRDAVDRLEDYDR